MILDNLRQRMNSARHRIRSLDLCRSGQERSQLLADEIDRIAEVVESLIDHVGGKTTYVRPPEYDPARDGVTNKVDLPGLVEQQGQSIAELSKPKRRSKSAKRK